jgi:hypothetical protein
MRLWERRSRVIVINWDIQLEEYSVRIIREIEMAAGE